MAINNDTDINVALVHLGKNVNEYQLNQSVPPHYITSWSSENKDAENKIVIHKDNLLIL